jgi:hypothetical protein
MIKSLPRQCIIRQKTLRSCEIDDIQIFFAHLQKGHLLNKEDYDANVNRAMDGGYEDLNDFRACSLVMII